MRNPPGPRGWEVLDFFDLKGGKHPLVFLERQARKHGPLTYFRLLHQHTYLPNDADLIKEILIVHQHRFGRDFGAAVLRELVGDGLITREEPLHKERRRLLQPAFHREQVAGYVDIIGNESARTLNQWVDGETVQVGDEMRRLTLAIIGGSLFGPEFRESATEISVILASVMKRASKIGPLISVGKRLIQWYRQKLPNARSLLFEEERKGLDRVLQPLIDRRRGTSGRDVLSLLLAQYDEVAGSLDDQDIRNEIITFVLAGHETTATALTWACYLLAKHPEVQRKLGEEAEAVLGQRELRPEDVHRLPYTSAVFNEALRLYPPVTIFGRRSLEPVKLGEYELPAGATVLLSPYIIQRNPRYWEEPDTFVPERWEKAEAIPKFAFFPFGGGAKMCIGEPLARAEGVLILADIFRSCELRQVSGHEEVGMNPRVTLTPDRPVVLRVGKRGKGANSYPTVCSAKNASSS